MVEEPPPDTVHILCADDTSRVLPTLVSRCQRVRIQPLSPERIESVLVAGGASAAEARLLASLAEGSLWRAAQMRSDDVLELRDQAVQLFAAGGASAAAIAQRVESVGRSWNPSLARRAIDLLLLWHHDLLWIGSGASRDAVVHLDSLPRLETAARAMSPREIRRRVEILEEMAEAVEQRVNPTLALQVALSRLASGAEAREPALF
jgi:DNA polymerase-3 subunit delta'